MMDLMKPVAAALMIALSTVASADGIDPLYDNDGSYIGDVEIIGDVVGTNGADYARLDIPALSLSLYVDPDAIYVMLTKDNPIINDQIPFGGYWIGRHPTRSGLWSECDFDSFPDETGRPFKSFGDLIWTNLSYSEEEGLLFAIDLGHCGALPVRWVTNRRRTSDQGSSGEGE
ncbi:hypothetical protein [Antarctobacter jejuensis]|uniref:hypothetical protein n=1 Tax=Antarctobacter jejuensis TaxID=1439938 RepID=UPI003FD10C76